MVGQKVVTFVVTIPVFFGSQGSNCPENKY